MRAPAPVILANAAFTLDMVETLQAYFSEYQSEDGVVQVEVTSHGLWLRHPHFPIRQFLGKATHPAQPVAYSPFSSGGH
ncbi:MAG: hypothetical protein AAF390_20390 [Pseudomonadota bacterium]